MKHAEYSNNVQARIKISRLADGMMDTIQEYLDKASEGYDKTMKELALVELGKRLNPNCGSCFWLPPIDEL